jgi:hypothetical protein
VGGLRFGRSQTDQFGSAVGEGSNDEDGAESGESVGKGTRTIPVPGANITLRTSTTTVNDDAQDNEAKASADLDAAEDEFDCDALGAQPPLRTWDQGSNLPHSHGLRKLG